MDPAIATRAARHAALGEPARLAITDLLAHCDRAPHELQQRLGIASNLLAHHLDVLEQVGLVRRDRSSGDGRRRYVHLQAEALDGLAAPAPVRPSPALFVCTANSARSQLAAVLWTSIVGEPARSAGTHPADRVHPGAVAAAARAGLDLSDAVPALLGPDDADRRLVITVCDRAHEELAPADRWLHWSIPDPVPVGSRQAFDRVVAELTTRIAAVRAA
jgi:protein-tyrosine-phosphatase